MRKKPQFRYAPTGPFQPKGGAFRPMAVPGSIQLKGPRRFQSYLYGGSTILDVFGVSSRMCFRCRSDEGGSLGKYFNSVGEDFRKVLAEDSWKVEDPSRVK